MRDEDELPDVSALLEESFFVLWLQVHCSGFRGCDRSPSSWKPNHCKAAGTKAICSPVLRMHVGKKSSLSRASGAQLHWRDPLIISMSLLWPHFNRSLLCWGAQSPRDEAFWVWSLIHFYWNITQQRISTGLPPALYSYSKRDSSTPLCLQGGISLLKHAGTCSDFKWLVNPLRNWASTTRIFMCF